jgi:hypothetical protein
MDLKKKTPRQTGGFLDPEMSCFSLILHFITGILIWQYVKYSVENAVSSTLQNTED